MEQLGTILVALTTLLGVLGQVWWSRSKQKCPPARLVELSDPKGQVYRLKGLNTQIGRKDWHENSIGIDNASISRRHARIEYRKAEKTFYLVDLGSTHGTQLNDQDIPKGDPSGVMLKHKDELALAGLRFSFLVDSEIAAEVRAKQAGNAIETAVTSLKPHVDPNVTK